MAIRFVMGPAGCGKTHTILNEIVSRSIEYPKQNFLVIAPEQFNLKTQALLTNLHPGGVILNIDVLSFNRLAYNVFNQVGFNVGTLLEEIGKIFILQKIALDKGQELPVIGSRMKKPGGLDEMKSVLSEMMQYDITIDKLEKYIDQEKNSLMKAKMTDILNVYKAYKEELGDRFMTAEEVPDKLCELVEESELIKDAV
ncbi:MAG: helicase-exonuclease AddAB subunit AddB, partial [Lachnospiraceae bacterium]|nr:helicase-exonuclease AddAB subunit AddB [Candidatus Equihabitans merdae]